MTYTKTNTYIHKFSCQTGTLSNHTRTSAIECWSDVRLNIVWSRCWGLSWISCLWDDDTLQTCINHCFHGISGIDESLDLEKILRGNDSFYSLLSWYWATWIWTGVKHYWPHKDYSKMGWRAEMWRKFDTKFYGPVDTTWITLIKFYRSNPLPSRKKYYAEIIHD